MIVTTSGRTTIEFIEKAKLVASDLSIPYIARNKKALSSFYDEHEIVIVVGKEGVQLYNRNAKEPYFFHPNLAMVRVKRLQKGQHDAFLEVVGLREGDSFLDCTLGYASDSIVASYQVGKKGKVLGIEASPILAYLTKKGLHNWEGKHEAIKEGMKRIEVVCDDHANYLNKLPTNSFDVVYFDPMFEESIRESNALQTLSYFTSHSNIGLDVIDAAKRVARKRVVLKDHFRSSRFEQLGFFQHVRKTSKFHYGTIDV